MKKRIFAVLMTFAFTIGGLASGAAAALAQNSRDSLLGVWRGTYINNLGLNGYEFLVFTYDGEKRAVVHFFPVAGSPAGQGAGSTLNEVVFDETTGVFEFIPIQNLEMPTGWTASGQIGTLSGDLMAGHIRNSPEFPFQAARVQSTNFPLNLPHDHLAMPGTNICMFCGITFVSLIITSPVANPGHAAAERFLTQFPSIFSLGRYWDGNFTHFFDSRIIFDEQPLVSAFRDENQFHMIYIDRDGNEIGEDVIFISDGLVADQFELFDFTGSGIPDILIRFIAETWAGWKLFVFADGQYQDSGLRLSWPRFFYDEQGNVIVQESDHGDTMIYRLYFADGAANREIIFDWDWHGPNFWINPHNPTLPGTNEPLTVVPRLTALEEQIYSSVHLLLLGYEPIILRLYIDPDAQGMRYSFMIMSIFRLSGTNWLEQAAIALGFPITAMWFEGSRLYVDLAAEAEWSHLQGTSGASSNVSRLALSLASLPGVEEMVFLLGGEKDRWGDHFSFEGVVQVTGLDVDRIWEFDGRPYGMDFQPGRLRWIRPDGWPNWDDDNGSEEDSEELPSPFSVNPDGLANISTPSMAINYIRRILTNLSPAQLDSDLILDSAAAYIENIARRGTTQTLPADGRLDADILIIGAAAASQIFLGISDIALRPNNVLNINFEVKDVNEIAVTFPDATLNIAFDNVTIEAFFGAITLHNNHLLHKAEVIFRPAILDAEAMAEVQSAPQTFQEIFTVLAETLTDFSVPMRILYNFWWVAALIVFTLIHIILYMCDRRLRLWVVPTFTILALAANMAMVLWLGDNPVINQSSAAAHYTQSDSPQIPIPNTYEVVMPPGMIAILSIPVDWAANPQFITVRDENGQIQNAEFNPITGNLDISINAGGVFTLR